MRHETPTSLRIQKARTSLILDHPFFGSLLFRLKGRECRSVQTMATDGVSLFYNPDFVETLNAATLAGTLAHEVMHPALHHHVRRSGRDPKRWNVACDFAINPLLVDAGLSLPDGVLIDDRFRGMSAEQIYNLLESQSESETEQDSGHEGGDDEPGGRESKDEASRGDSNSPSAPVTEGGIGQVLDAQPPEEGTPNIEEQAREWDVAVNQATTVARQAGKVPAGLHRTLEGAAEASVDRRELLRRLWSETTPADYSWMRPNRRHLWTGLYLPGVVREGVGEGMQCLENREDVSLRKAVACFKRAISKNPSHVLAWVGLAEAYLILGIHCVDAPHDTFPKALAAAKEAATINASLPEVIHLFAMVELCYLRKFKNAEEKFHRVLKAKPSLAFAHNGLGLLQAATGRAEEFVSLLHKAITFSPLSPPLNAFLCYSLCFTRRFEDAIIAGKKAVLADPESCLAHVYLGNALLCQAEYTDALIHLDNARSLSHESKTHIGFWAYGCALAGLRERAEQGLSKLMSLPQHEYVPSYFVGLIYLGLGHFDLAIDWLNRACDERSHWVIFVNSDPTFDELRKHPGFKDILDKVGLQNLGDGPKGRRRNRKANDAAR